MRESLTVESFSHKHLMFMTETFYRVAGKVRGQKNFAFSNLLPVQKHFRGLNFVLIP